MGLIPLCLIGALISLDTVAVFQILISQPIVACTLIGWLSNDPMTGIHIGLLMQLIWISTLPVGAVTFPDGNLGAIIAAIIAVNTIDIIPQYKSLVILFSVLFGLFMSFIGAHALNTVRTGNVYILNKLLDRIEAFKLNQVGKAISWSLTVNFIILFVITLISTLIGIAIIEAVFTFNLTSWIRFTRYAEIVILGSGAGLTFTLVKGYKPKGIIAVFILISLVILQWI
ncbi:MAG: PTS sugar transporter subunit IIC [Calditrichaceae bacterium]|nr:PTS sugar transporter subunit IIC [Calditrichaceae bacterium]